jgi:DNA-binding NarL/FixJ family response regulator
VTIRVLVADDQQMVRAGLRMMLESMPDVEVVGEAGDGHTAVAEARRLAPDVCLVDVRMPGIDGVEVTRQVVAGSDGATAVVVVTTFDLDEYVFGALDAGALGFLLKDASAALVAEAVRAAASGDALVAPAVTSRLLRELGRRGARPPEPVDPLSEREEQVLRALADGRTNAEIAEVLHVSLSTVKTHVNTLLTKVGARNRVELAVWALRTGRAS